MTLRRIPNSTLIDWAKIDNLPADTQTEIDGKLDSVVAGINITVDDTDPNNPIISNTWSWSGDVVWPAGATDNAIARYDDVTGKLIQDSWATIDDSGNLTANNISWTNTGDMSDSDVKIAYEANADTNAYTDNEKTVVGNTSNTNTWDQDSSMVITDTEDYFTTDTVEWALAELWRTMKWDNWFDLRDWNNWELSFDDWPREFFIDVASWDSNFYFRCSGKVITHTTAQSVIIPDITDTYYIYFDNSWVLQYVALTWLDLDQFYQHAIVWLIYRNATAGTAMVGEERHWVRMDSRTHHYNHNTLWARYANGLNPTGLVDGSPTYTNVTSWEFWDEDIQHIVTLSSTHPFIYRLWATGEWTWLPADNGVWYKSGWASYYQWNEWTGSTRQLTEWGSSTDYFITFFVSTPDIYWNNVKKIIWQNAYSSRWDARDAIYTEINNLNTNWLPSVEMVFLYAVIVKRNWDLEDLWDWATYLDLRSTKWVGGTSSTWDMNDPMTTRWDMIVRDDSNITARLWVGTNWQFVGSDWTDIVWATPAGWSWTSNLINIAEIDWQIYTGNIQKYIVSDAGTISKVKASLWVLPTTTSFKVDIRLNWVASTDSIFTSDTPLEITTSQSTTNWVYTVDKTTIDNGAVVADDVVYVIITQIGSWISGSDLNINIEL